MAGCGRVGRAADLVAGCGWGARQQQGDWLAAAGLELTAGRSRLAASALAAWQVDLAASHPGTFYLPAEAAWGPAGRGGSRPGREATAGRGTPGNARVEATSPPARHPTLHVMPLSDAHTAMAARSVTLAAGDTASCGIRPFTPGQARGWIGTTLTVTAYYVTNGKYQQMTEWQMVIINFEGSFVRK